MAVREKACSQASACNSSTCFFYNATSTHPWVLIGGESDQARISSVYIRLWKPFLLLHSVVSRRQQPQVCIAPVTTRERNLKGARYSHPEREAAFLAPHRPPIMLHRSTLVTDQNLVLVVHRVSHPHPLPFPRHIIFHPLSPCRPVSP